MCGSIKLLPSYKIVGNVSFKMTHFQVIAVNKKEGRIGKAHFQVPIKGLLELRGQFAGNIILENPHNSLPMSFTVY